MKPSHKVRLVFDDPNLVSAAGLLPVLELAGAAGINTLLAGVTVPSANAVLKTTSLVAAMLAGADCIDDTDLLGHGGMARVFTGIRAPSTLGTFLRVFTHGHVQQLDNAGAGLLGGLAAQVPDLPGDTGPQALAFLDVDDTVREVHGDDAVTGRRPHRTGLRYTCWAGGSVWPPRRAGADGPAGPVGGGVPAA